MDCVAAVCCCIAQLGFVALVVVWLFAGYFPLIKRLDVKMKRARALLLLFPDEVVLGVAAIKNLFLTYSRTIDV